MECCDIPPVQMGLASIVHLYVFPSTPYELMGDPIPESVPILGDYASVDCPLDPEMKARSGMTIKESVKDVFIGGGEYVSLQIILIIFVVGPP